MGIPIKSQVKSEGSGGDNEKKESKGNSSEQDKEEVHLLQEGNIGRARRAGILDLTLGRWVSVTILHGEESQS